LATGQLGSGGALAILFQANFPISKRSATAALNSTK